MRQIYSAMLITLRGDHKHGSIASPVASPQCVYHRQFYEKQCGLYSLDHGGKVCDGRLHLEPFLNNYDGTDACRKINGSVVLWSFGNHKCTRYGRTGVNNATELRGCFENNICRELNTEGKYSPDIAVDNTCSTWWVSTHYRVVAHFSDETIDRVKTFNEGMRQHFDAGGCGPVNYIDVYNMTRELTVNHLAEAEKMTYDKVHWGMEVNLVKAQIILNALLSSK